jgi:hypothetical protein
MSVADVKLNNLKGCTRILTHARSRSLDPGEIEERLPTGPLVAAAAL